jgi:hypothetical protein
MLKLRSDQLVSQSFPMARVPISLILSVFSALSAISVFSLAHAQTAPDDVDEFVTIDAPSVALVHVRVIDGTGAQPADDQTILISKGRIERVGPSRSIDVPA